MGGWIISTYLRLAAIIGCAEAAEGTNFETKRLMPLLEHEKFKIREESLKRMLERNRCFDGRGHQKQRGCPLMEGEKCSFVPFSTWSRRK